MTDDLAQRLLNMQKAIDAAKTEVARLEGQKAELQNRRATELGCSTDEEAQEYIQELNQEIAEVSQQLQEGVKAVEEELGWNKQ